MHIRIKLVFVVFIGLIFACSNQKDKEPAEKNNRAAANETGWTGTYKGVIPCADCQGIEVDLTLSGDQTYKKLSKYLGKAGDVIEEQGDFIWNAEGDKITINPGTPDEEKYLVGENYIILLDQKGERITGELEDKYMLYKTGIDNYDFSKVIGKKWELEEINSRKIDNPGIFITFNENNELSGFGSCNNFSGNYKLGEEGNLVISENIAMTKMICPTRMLEDEFMDVLTRIDGFFLYGNKLMLTKAKRSAIAVFELSV